MTDVQPTEHESIVDQINAIQNTTATADTTNTTDDKHDTNTEVQDGSDTTDGNSKYNQRKRRRLVELRDDELWHCTYYPCKKVYSMKSTASIQQHKKTCVLASQHLQYCNMMLPYNNMMYNKQLMPNMIPQMYYNNLNAVQQQQTRLPPQIQQQIQLASSQHLPVQAYALHDPYTPHTASNTNAVLADSRLYHAATAPLIPNQPVQQLHENLAISGQKVNFPAGLNYAQLTHDTINNNKQTPNSIPTLNASFLQQLQQAQQQYLQPAQPHFTTPPQSNN